MNKELVEEVIKLKEVRLTIIERITNMRTKVHCLRDSIIKSAEIPDCASKKNVVKSYNTMLLVYDKILKELNQSSEVLVWKVGDRVRTQDAFNNYEIVELKENTIIIRKIGTDKTHEVKYDEIY